MAEQLPLWKGRGGTIIKWERGALGLALTLFGCCLSRQANGIQVSRSPGHLWKHEWYPGAMTQRCLHYFLLWVDLLPQPSLPGTVLYSFSMDNTGTKPSAWLIVLVSLKPFICQNCSWRQVTTHCSFKSVLDFCPARPSVAVVSGFG